MDYLMTMAYIAPGAYKKKDPRHPGVPDLQQVCQFGLGPQTVGITRRYLDSGAVVHFFDVGVLPVLLPTGGTAYGAGAKPVEGGSTYAAGQQDLASASGRKNAESMSLLEELKEEYEVRRVSFAFVDVEFCLMLKYVYVAL